MSDKICPLTKENCIEGECAWWIGGYTTEGTPCKCCAIEMIALKNSDGRYNV